MNNSNIFGIRNRFKVTVGAAALSIIFVTAMFVRSFYAMKDYDRNVRLSVNLSLEQHNMHNFELMFLTEHKKNNSFYKSGRHVNINNFETASLNFDDLLSELANKFENTDIEKNIAALKVLNNDYHKLFNEFHNNLYLRGSEMTGKISEIRKNSDSIVAYAQNAEMKSKCQELNILFDEYLIDNNVRFYNKFCVVFDKIANSLNTQVIRPTDSENLLISSGSDLSNVKLVRELNKYMINFKKLYEIDRKLGFNSDDGLRQSLKRTALQFKPEIREIRNKTLQEKTLYYDGELEMIIIFGVLLLILLALFGFFMFRNTTTALQSLSSYFKPLSKGILPDNLLVLRRNMELQDMNESINELIKGLKRTTHFAQQIGQGTFDTDFEPLSEQDTLGNSLIEMRKNLVKAQEDEKNRQQEDSYRKWASEGLTEFNEILRQNADNIDKLTLSIVRHITKFMSANQAGLFLINDTDESDIHLELVATYAYDHERKKKKKIYLGEGLVGMCAVEKSTVYLEDIPDGYLNINSGLGGSNPRSLLIVPLKIEDQIFGVIEIASFNTMQKHEIEFVEKVTEGISSTLSLAKINARTAMLLEKSQRQAEEMATQEEEMRKNFEKLNINQEKSMRREAEMRGIIQAINTSSFVIEFDTSGYITNANDAFLQLLNVEVSQLIGKHQSDFENMDKANIRPESFWQRLRNGEIITEVHKIFSGENARWLHEIYTPILDKDGTPYKILNLATDITNNKKLEEQLRAKTKEISAQKEELEGNVIELAAIQRAMQKKQSELEDANNQIKANEQELRDIITKTKENENDLKKRNAELAAQEIEYVKSIQEMEIKVNRVSLKNEEFKKINSQLKNNAITMKNIIEDLRNSKLKLENEMSLKNKETSELAKKIENLEKEINNLKN